VSAKVRASNAIRTVNELLETLKSGRGVYAASGVNSSWMNSGYARSDTLDCGGDRGGSGHAYSLAGFAVPESGQDGVLFVKNSWGTNWG
jgi:C1A family cysteine protease